MMRCRVLLLGTTLCFCVHAATAKDRVHIGFDGYRSSSNDYCITARSVQGDPLFGYLWRFTAGGGPSEPVGTPNAVNLLTSDSIELFPTSLADREKFRVYDTPLGPIVGGDSISNELNARRSQICLSGGGGGGGSGGGGGGSGGGGGGSGGGGGGSGGGGGGSGGGGGGSGGGGGGSGGGHVAVDNSNVHRQLGRLLGTDFGIGADLIPNAIRCGFDLQPSDTSETSFKAGHRWCAWATPQQVNYRDHRSGLDFTGTLRDITFGMDIRVRHDLVVGLAFTPQDAEVKLEGLPASIQQKGFGGGPYLGWRVRPTTLFDIWAGYEHLDRSFDIFGIGADASVDRTFITTNLTEIIDTPWMRILPRVTYYYGNDDVDSFQTNVGFTLLGTRYEYSYVEGSVELNREFMVSTQLLLRPFVQATVRYDTKPIVDTISTIDGTNFSVDRWHGQVRGGFHAQVGDAVLFSLSGGYLTLGNEDIEAWESRVNLSVRF